MKRKRMRLPNGFGQISEIKGRRLRKPFRAMVTVGKTEEGRPICKTLKPVAYFRTYNEAYEALVRYNKSPYSVDLTMQDLFTMWFEEYKKKGVTEKTLNRTPTLWSYMPTLHEKNIGHVKTIDLKEAIDLNEHRGINVQKKLKSILNLMFDYAVMLEYTDKNYARNLKLNIKEANTENYHQSYSDEEMEILWKNKQDDIVKAILIQCYMGWRPQELLNIRLSGIDLNARTIKGGSKTEAGRNRIVPIHSRIKSLVVELINKAENIKDERLFYFIPTYFFYRKKMTKVFFTLHINIDHKPHDARKQFVTMAKRANMNEYAIKRIIGHAITDLTENIYTDRDIEWLRVEIEKIV